MLQHDLRHGDRAFVMGDHAAYEIDIGVAGEVYHHVGMHGVIRGHIGGGRGGQIGCVAMAHGAVVHCGMVHIAMVHLGISHAAKGEGGGNGGDKGGFGHGGPPV